MPAKVFSYFAAGKPMLFAMDGEVQQIMSESKAGYSVDAGDYLALAEKIEKLYSATESEKEQMEKNAKNYYYQNFERGMNMKKLIDFMWKSTKEV